MSLNNNEKFFLGIDLGKKNKRTSAICFLRKEKEKILPCEKWCKNCQDILGKDVFNKIKPFLRSTKIIAFDSPLTIGRGKGKMRLFEKFFSRKIFKEAKINPIFPSLIPEVCNFSLALKKKLEKEGFILDINLIETSARLVNAFLNRSFFFPERKIFCKSENQFSAFLSAKVAFLHSIFQTRYIGYKDGFLFLPKFSFWNKEWKIKFSLAWKNRPRLKYRYLITNIFEK